MIKLEDQFHRDMVAIYETAKRECGYNAAYFLQMLAERGGLKTAQHLLATSQPSSGFTALWEFSRLDLTVEALVLQPVYTSLFTDAERQTARARLQEYGFTTKLI